MRPVRKFRSQFTIYGVTLATREHVFELQLRNAEKSHRTIYSHVRLFVKFCHVQYSSVAEIEKPFYTEIIEMFYNIYMLHNILSLIIYF